MRISAKNGVGSRGFTLIEVVLAIVIGVGLFSGVLMFYQQSAVLREEILRKADALSAVRLVMDRISTELRTIPPSTAGVSILSGDSRSLRILHTAVPSKAPWRGGNLGRASLVEADWVEVSYRWSSDTNQPGLYRQERTHTASAPVSTNLLAEIELPTGNSTNAILPSGGIPLSEAIAYLRFRYWTEAVGRPVGRTPNRRPRSKSPWVWSPSKTSSWTTLPTPKAHPAKSIPSKFSAGSSHFPLRSHRLRQSPSPQ